MVKFAHSFCILAEELHFGRAALRLAISQPALSHQIKTLEHDIGCTLLRRSPHQVTLTDAGTVLARELGAALAQAARAVREAQDVARGEAGALAIGYCELPFSGGLGAILCRFTTKYPRVEVALHSLPTHQQAASLVAGTIDIAFLHPPLEAPDLILRPAGQEPMMLALPLGHALAVRPRVRLAELAGERLIFCRQATAPNMHRALLAACGRSGFQPRLREEDASWHNMAGMAAAGLGVALVPASLAATSATHVAFKAVTDLNLMLQTAIATLGEPTRPAAQRFLALCPAPPPVTAPRRAAPPRRPAAAAARSA